MKIVNFSHPLTKKQMQQVAAITGQEVEEIIEVSSQIDPNDSLSPQIEKMLDLTNFSIGDWQTLPILINLPALNVSAAVMLAHLHGRMGYSSSAKCKRCRNVGPLAWTDGLFPCGITATTRSRCGVVPLRSS